MRKFRQIINMRCPMRDGVELSCDVRLPIGDGPFPVILSRTPYNKSRITTDGSYLGWIESGYGFVTVDCRGCHESDGQYEPFFQEIEDGADTIKWLKEQDFCNGKIATAGGSYVGWTQYAASICGDESLKAITPIVMGTDPYMHLSHVGGSVSLFLLWWLILNDGRSQREDIGINWQEHYNYLPVNEMDSDVGCESPYMHKWLSHPTRDEFWKKPSVYDRLENSKAAALLAGGWYDPFVNGQIDTFCKLSELRKDGGREVRLIIGPWGHGINTSTTMGDVNFGGDAIIDFDNQKKDFITQHIDGDESTSTGPAVKVFFTGENNWENFDCWPPEKATEREFFLGSKNFANSCFGDGFLTEDVPEVSTESDQYDYDPANPAPAIGGASLMIVQPDGPMDQRPAERRDDILCYTTEKFTEPVKMAGKITLELNVSSSAKDTDFIGRICDVLPDGKVIYVCDGLLRMRFRNGFDREVFMENDQVYKVQIDLGHRAHTFGAGSRLRLEVTSSCMPRFDRNLNTGGDNSRESAPVVAKQTIFHSKTHPSKLILPVID